MVVAKPKFKRRADHARGADAANGRCLERVGLAGARVDEHRAFHGEGDLLPGRDIGRAADYGSGLAIADVHGGQHQAVGVGVRVNAEHMAHDEAIGVEFRADDFDIADFVARHGEAVRQLVGGQVELDVVSEPG